MSSAICRRDENDLVSVWVSLSVRCTLPLLGNRYKLELFFFYLYQQNKLVQICIALCLIVRMAIMRSIKRHINVFIKYLNDNVFIKCTLNYVSALIYQIIK